VKKRTQKKQRVEQEKANQAEAQLAAAREKAAEKQEAKVAVNEGKKPGKRHKIRREKIRYGQAPSKSLPTAATQTTASDAGSPLGQTAGAAMAATESTTTITTGTGVEEASSEGLAPRAVSDHKTRLTDRERESEAKRAEEKLAKAEVKASKRPTPATSQETVDEKVRAAPLGLNGNTGKKKKTKVKRAKDEPKERLQEKPKPVETPQAAPAPTVNPALGTAPAPASSTPQ
jgi:peptidyl-prolyl cis-trans isomerase SurA